jgi:dynein heavy chain
MTPDELVLEKARDILQRLPEVLDKKGGSPELFATTPDGLIPSLSTVLLQEMEKFNRLLGVMRTTLGDIDLAIKGFIVMGSELDSMYVKLQNNQVPVVWAKVAYPSLKPLGAWIADLIERVAVMAAWLQNGNPSAYWMPGLFFPQGFLTGVLQTHARQYKIAIDKLAFAFEILGAEGAEDIDAKPDDGVYIYGLFLDGARWDRETALIADQLPAKMAETMPVLWFKPQEDYKPDPEEYQAPCYKTSVRAGTLSTTGQSTNHILNVSLPTKDPPAQWVQRAAALLCMLNE